MSPSEGRSQVLIPGNSSKLVLVTAPDGEEAEALSRKLVEEGLAACVNLLAGVKSIYGWKGKVETSQESLLLIKTTDSALEALGARVKELHSYDVPEFLVLPVESGLEAYLTWVKEEVR